MPSEWYDSGCGGPRARWLDDGQIEVEGEPAPYREVPDGVYQWRDLIIEMAAKHSLPPHFVAGIMSLESGGRADAGSPAGAMGLMQLILPTARAMAGDDQLTAEEVYDPRTNVDLGCRFLKQLWDRYDGSPIKIPFGYNAGSARCGTGTHRGQYGSGEPCAPNRWGLVADCWGKDAVTIDYAGIVMGYANAALAAGFPADAQAVSESPTSAATATWGKRIFLMVAGVAVAIGALSLIDAARKRKNPSPLALFALVPFLPP